MITLPFLFLSSTFRNVNIMSASEETLGVAARLARKNILELQPYRCARDDYSDGVLLDANENAYGPAAAKNTHTLERYPDPYQVPLKEKLCAYRGNGLKPVNVFVGVGSDEAIDLLMRIFCRPGQDKILQTPPTYGMYKVCAKVNDVEIVNVPLTPDFSLRIPEVSVEAVLYYHIRYWFSNVRMSHIYLSPLNTCSCQILDAVTPEVKLLFLCSPGNPTSKALPIEDIVTIAESEKYSGIVVVDEAYVDFSAKGSAVTLVNKYPNVVVLQTLSKAFGLAAIRCGFCIGAPDVIQLMNNVKAPYNINAMTSEMATAAFDNIHVLDANIKNLLEQRVLVAAELEKLDFVTKVYPSDSNFVLFRLREKAQLAYKTMADGGVVTRFRGAEIHCNECIRVTIGTPKENQAFLGALKMFYR